MPVHMLDTLLITMGEQDAGLVILRHCLPQTSYLHFTSLPLADYLLAHPKLHESPEESVRTDLPNFLNEYEWCYGQVDVVYNMPLLEHIPDEVSSHEPSDSFPP
ncbi:unnamed protein product [Schistosoma mattheei]|uniref:Uncharacterized protein n=1 Tax=Schistosoma mattheei TaxID=31246 RepID=A0A183P8Z1_9TREM|nr:unnamed protein product [Schistosoma mattheei]